MSRSCLKFRGGNEDRKGIYSSLTEVISDAISFVNPLHGALAKKCAFEAHEMAQTVLKIALLMAMIYFSMQPTPSLENIYISPGRVQKRYFEPFFSIHVIHVIANLGVGYDLFMK